MIPQEKLEPYYRNQFEVTFKEANVEAITYTHPTLTEYCMDYKIEDRILWVGFEVSQGMLLSTIESLKTIKAIEINHFDKQGNVYLWIGGAVDYINFSGLSGSYEEVDFLRIKASFVYKELNITEQPYNDFTIKTIKLF